MKLYDMTRAPNPRRVRIFLAEKGIEVDTVQVDVLAGENLTDDYLKINPRGLIPSLELDDGTCLTETVAICRYLEETHPDPPLMGASPLDKARVEMWQRVMEQDGLAAVGETYRNSAPNLAGRRMAGTAGGDQIPEIAEQGRERVAEFLDMLDERLGASDYVAGDSFSIADITALCTVDFARAIHMAPADSHTNIKRWHAVVSDRPSARA